MRATFLMKRNVNQSEDSGKRRLAGRSDLVSDSPGNTQGRTEDREGLTFKAK